MRVSIKLLKQLFVLFLLLGLFSPFVFASTYGGGGGGGGTTPTPTPEVPEGDTLILNPTCPFIEEVAVHFNQEINGNIPITPVNNHTGVQPSQCVYAYCQAHYQNIPEGSVDEVKWTLKLPNEWLEDNDINDETFSVYINGSWQSVQINPENSTAEYTFYIDSQTPLLDTLLYTIGGDCRGQISPTPTGHYSPTPTTTESPTPTPDDGGDENGNGDGDGDVKGDETPEVKGECVECEYWLILLIINAALSTLYAVTIVWDSQKPKSFLPGLLIPIILFIIFVWINECLTFKYIILTTSTFWVCKFFFLIALGIYLLIGEVWRRVSIKVEDRRNEDKLKINDSITTQNDEQKIQS